ncbi:MAG: FtsW/RodA/SpoVE family cell cycle protein [Anaerolineae bacterium]|nr:FtsW/RodA/SpoVE family cell cycle protein [Anaerolineae bacterium]
MTKRKGKTTHVDYLLLVTLLALLAVGLLMLYSATFYVGVEFWQRQLVWVGAGSVLALALVYLPYPVWQRLALPLMLAALLLLTVVLLGGEQTQAAQRRALLGSSIQPGVLARLVVVIYIAAWLASKGEQLHQMRYGLVPFAMIIGVVAGLVTLQPDLSTAALLIATGLAMFFFAGGDPLQIFMAIITGGASFGFLAWRLPHARKRLVDYVAALKDPAQMSYHIHCAVTAIGEGGLLGVGIGNGRLKAWYLPFPHTDSIFAIVGEEMGLLGSLLVLGLFGLLAYRGYRIALETADPFGSLLAFGVTTMIIVEVLLNVLVITGLLPFTGTALPFFSYGGSEMLITMAGAGMLLGISRGRPKGDAVAILDRWWRDWRARLSRIGRSASIARR